MEALVASLSQDLGVTIQRAQPGTPEYMIGEACSRGEVETVERLLNEGVSVSSLDKTGRPLLTVAAAFGHTNVCRLLLERGADIHMKCIGVGLELVQINGQAIHSATNQGNYATVEFLLSVGADVNASLDATSLYSYFQRFTPMHMAASRGHTQVLKLLASHGGDPLAPSYIRIKGMPRPYFSGVTPFHAAAFTHQVGALRVFLHDLKLDPNMCDKETGTTPLHAAVALRDTASIPLLLQAGANINAQMVGEDGNGLTPLHITCMFGNVAGMQMLLQNGADTEIKTLDGLTPQQLILHPQQRALYDRLVAERANAVNPGGGAAARPALDTNAAEPSNVRNVDLEQVEALIDSILMGKKPA